MFHIVESDVEAELKQPSPVAVYPVKILSSADGADYVASQLAPILAYEPTGVAERLRDGDAVAIAYDGTQAVGCIWIAVRRKVPMPLQTTWRIGSGEAVLYHSFVLPAWRGKRIHRSIDQAANAYLHARGIGRTLGSMSVLNPQTLSLAKRHGKQFVMKLWLVHIPSLDWTWRHAQGRPFEAHFEAAELIPTAGHATAESASR